MSDRQQYVDRIRKLQEELNAVLLAGKFTKESERFMVQEAVQNLDSAEKHLNGFLQVDKYNNK